MRISNAHPYLLAVLLAIMPVTPTLAFDASTIVENDAETPKIFKFFFSFRKDGKEEEALSVLKYAADNGNPAAQWKLGRMYQTGDGVEKDSLAAFDIFQKIAERYPDARPNSPDWQFSADALVALGTYYRQGIPNSNVSVDPGKARMMYTTAAMVFRHPVAQFELGRMQLANEEKFGQGKLGIRNLSLAYEKGHVGAEALLGYSVFEGEHVRRDAVQGLVMLGNARRRANADDLSWIMPLHEEALAIAKPEERGAATQILLSSTALE